MPAPSETYLVCDRLECPINSLAATATRGQVSSGKVNLQTEHTATNSNIASLSQLCQVADCPVKKILTSQKSNLK